MTTKKSKNSLTAKAEDETPDDDDEEEEVEEVEDVVDVEKAQEQQQPPSRTTQQPSNNKRRGRRNCIIIAVTVILLILIIFVAIIVPKRVPPPPNDTCDTAATLPLDGSIVYGTLVGASPENGGSRNYASGSDADPAVWYTFNTTKEDNTQIQISLEGLGGGSFAVYEGSCDGDTDSLVEINTKIPFDGDGFMFGYDTAYYDHATFIIHTGVQYYVFIAACACDHCIKDFHISAKIISSPASPIAPKYSHASCYEECKDIYTGNPLFVNERSFRAAVHQYLDDPDPNHHQSGYGSKINCWDVSRVNDMSRAFENAEKFNEPLDCWNTGRVIEIYGMFEGAASFNQPLNNWNTTRMKRMMSMFRNAQAFNQSLDRWDMRNVISVVSMFEDAKSFNQPLDMWNISKVKYITSMFEGASSFNRNLCAWAIYRLHQSGTEGLHNMFLNSGCDEVGNPSKTGNWCQECLRRRATERV